MRNEPENIDNTEPSSDNFRQLLEESKLGSNYRLNMKFRDERIVMSVDDFTLKDDRKLYHSMAASSAVCAMEVKKENIRESLISLSSIEHRSQFVATVKGVDFVNDSKATNVNSTWYELERMKKPVVLILGGVDNGNDYRILNDMIREKVRGIVCLGVYNERIHEAFEGVTDWIEDASSAEDAVKRAFRLAQKGDVVLLSPACASFDLFKNYEDRGEQFMAAVKNL